MIAVAYIKRHGARGARAKHSQGRCLSLSRRSLAGFLILLLLLSALLTGCGSGSGEGEAGIQGEGKLPAGEEREGLLEDPSDPDPGQAGQLEAPSGEGPADGTGGEGPGPGPVDQLESDGEDSFTCTISISCATLLDNKASLNPEKVELVPGDGWILRETEAVVYEGESVFNLLARICKQEKIHMEYVNTPFYSSAFIEGIHNLYEFDGGPGSGWLYSVNDWYPNYGCSRYALKAGDQVRWSYTCDLGLDLGAGYAAEDQFDRGDQDAR